MKGLLLSSAVFLVYVLCTALISHFGKIRVHSKLFVRSAVVAAPVFLLSFSASPRDLWCLPLRFQAYHEMLDAAFGLAILLLNIHSYMVWFYGTNCGFSTSMMLLLLAREPRGLSTEDLIAEYRDKDGRDKIHGWRVPRLAETGYLDIDPYTRICTLTEKGRNLARFTRFLKSLLNLGRGG